MYREGDRVQEKRHVFRIVLKKIDGRSLEDGCQQEGKALSVANDAWVGSLVVDGFCRRKSKSRRRFILANGGSPVCSATFKGVTTWGLLCRYMYVHLIITMQNYAYSTILYHSAICKSYNRVIK